MNLFEEKLEDIKFIVIAKGGISKSICAQQCCEGLDSAILCVTQLFEYADSIRFINLETKEDHIFHSRHEFDKHVGISIQFV